MFRVFGYLVPTDRFLLASFEVLLMGVAAYSITLQGTHILHDKNVDFSILIAGTAIVSMAAVGLFNFEVFQSYRMMLVKTVVAFGLAAPLICVIILFLGTSHEWTFAFWGLWYLKVFSVWCLCVAISHNLFRWLVDVQALKHRVAVIGTGERAARIRQLARPTALACFSPVAFVACGTEAESQTPCSFKLDEQTDDETFAKFLRGLHVSELVVAVDDRRGVPTRPLLACKMRGFRVTEFLSFWERESGRVEINALQPSWMLFSDGFHSSWSARIAKRGFDVIASSAMLLITSPLLLLFAALIKLDSPGPLFYHQERVGRFGRTFTLVKLRSMRQEAEKDGNPCYALERDPRVTRVGALIRKLRIDELPQLFNVLRGEMSFVGPRPERPFFVDQFNQKIRFYSERHGVKPGITGWAQIKYPYGACIEDAQRKLEYDLYYVKNHTIFLDLAILIETVRVILFPSGAR